MRNIYQLIRVIDFHYKIPGEDQSHHYPLHIQNQQHRPPSEHIYFSIESDYNSALGTANAATEFMNSAAAATTLNTNQIHRPTVPTQQWQLIGTHKNSTQPPHMV